MSILMTFALLSPAVHATSSPSVTVGNSTGKDGDTVQVAVSIQDNPGLIAMRLYVGYDASKLQLLDAQDQGIFGTANAYFGKDKTKNPYTLLWEDALAEENYTANGDLAVLTFKILDDAEPGESAITLTLDQGSTINVGVDNVMLQMINGSITIKGDEPPAVGTSTVTCASASAEAGDTVNIAVSIQNNPGLIAMRLYVSYDADKLQLLDAQDQGLFGSGNAYFGKVKTAIPYALLWEDALAEENYTGNGTLAILSFKVLDNAQAGNTEIVLSLDQGSTINVDVENVSLQLVNGTVTITGGDEPPVVQTPTIALADVEANAGDTIEVPIYIQNNPGLIALKFSVSYDAEVLTLLSAIDAGIFGSGNAYFGKRLTDIPYVLLWEDALADDNYQGNGLLATLTFKVADGAQTGETAVSISMDNGSTIDVDLTEIHFDVKGSTVSVTKTEIPPEQHPTIAVGTVVGRVGETVQVPITISDNPGLIGSKLMISYDPDILTLTDVTDGEIFGTNNAYFGNRLSDIPYTLMWEDSLTESNYTGNGTLAILTFTIAQDAYGQEAAITLQYNLGSSINVDLQEIPFTLENGKVSVDNTAVFYTVAYDGNGATGGAVPADQAKKQYIALTLVENTGSLTKTGYTLDGWAISADGEKVYDLGGAYTANEDVTLYAHWLPYKIPVIFRDLAQEKMTTVMPTFTAVSNQTARALTWSCTTGGIFTINGSTTASKSLTSIQLPTSTVAGEVYKVTIDKIGGSLSDGLVVADLSEDGDHSLSGGVQNGQSINSDRQYTQIGAGDSATKHWAIYETKNNIQPRYIRLWVCPSSGSDAVNVTDYQFKITVQKVSGATSAIMTYDSMLGAVPIPTRTGYTFDGWFTEVNGGLQVTESTTFSSTDRTVYYAQWTVNQYYLDVNGSLDNDSIGNITGYGLVDVYINGNCVSYDTSDYYRLWDYGTPYEIRNIRAVTGHRYVGTNSELIGTVGSEEQKTNISLHFATNNYKIAYDANTGNGAAPAEHANVYYDNLQNHADWITSVTAEDNTFVKKGYSFIGWNTKADGSGITIAPGDEISAKELVDALEEDPGNGSTLMLYAQWEKIYAPGDADEDGEITLQDVAMIARWLAGGWNVTIDEANSDVNHDGVINLKDAVLIRRYLAGGWGVVLQ